MKAAVTEREVKKLSDILLGMNPKSGATKTVQQEEREREAQAQDSRSEEEKIIPPLSFRTIN